MARIDKPLQRREFNFRNDPVDPSVIYWGMATLAQWDAYEQEMLKIAGPPVKGKRLTEAQINAGAVATRAFVFGRIVGVKGFSVDDGNGGDKPLVWPDDKAQVLATLNSNPDFAGGIDLFVRTVTSFHRPADDQALAAANATTATE